MFHAFIFCCCCLVGVFADEVKSVSVMEGDSVTLQINVTEIQTGDRILWKFGTNNSLIAKIIQLNSDIPKELNERFRDRLKLDKKTGSLTITDITTEHAGDYVVEIKRSSSSEYRFTVTVTAATTVPVTRRDSTSFSPSSGLSKCEHVNITDLCQTCAELHGHCCDSVEAVLRLVVTALMGVAAAAAAVLLVNDVRSTRD